MRGGQTIPLATTAQVGAEPTSPVAMHYRFELLYSAQTVSLCAFAYNVPSHEKPRDKLTLPRDGGDKADPNVKFLQRAAAAQDLYAACEKIRDWDRSNGDNDLLCEAASAARAALAKADGSA